MKSKRHSVLVFPRLGELLNIDGVKNDFNGDFSDFSQWTNPGVYRYNINTQNTGTIDGPEGITPVYGILEIIVRTHTTVISLNVVVQKFYSHLGEMKMRICTRTSTDPVNTWNTREWKKIY